MTDPRDFQGGPGDPDPAKVEEIERLRRRAPHRRSKVGVFVGLGILAVMVLLAVLACTNGLAPIMPGDPDYELVCVDSLGVDTTRACFEVVTIELIITIPNPNVS